MGCDIHAHAERKDESGNWVHIDMVDPLGGRYYPVFIFLAGVRSDGECQPISNPRGMPDDVCQKTRSDHDSWGWDAHSASWLSIDELLSFDYSQVIEPNQYTCERQTLAEFLGPTFQKNLAALKEAGAERVVFWFDC